MPFDCTHEAIKSVCVMPLKATTKRAPTLHALSRGDFGQEGEIFDGKCQLLEWGATYGPFNGS